MCNSHCDTQHPFGAGRGAGDGATRLTSGQHWDQDTAGEKNLWGNSHTTELYYTVWETEVDSQHREGIAIVWREAEG